VETTNADAATVTWQLLKKAGDPGRIAIDSSRLINSPASRRIRCPRCEWQPRASDQWVCWSSDGPEPPFDACGTAWNTFATRGRCPGCAHQWAWTSCLQCDSWSLHEDWYEDEGHD
jgi:hypothetical protein